MVLNIPKGIHVSRRTNSNREAAEWRAMYPMPSITQAAERNPGSSVIPSHSLSNTLVLGDVAFGDGDVFLCSGQSNMEHPAADAPNCTAEPEALSYSDLRMLNLAGFLYWKIYFYFY